MRTTNSDSLIWATLIGAVLVIFIGCASTSDGESEHHHEQIAKRGDSHDDHDDHEKRGGPDQHEGHEGHDDHDDREPRAGHDDHEGHDHGETNFDRGALARVRDQRCEHEVLVLECDECRYEVGAVEVVASLLDPEGDDLIRTTKLESRALAQGLKLTGEVSFDERRIAHISPRIDGVVRQVYTSLGQRVEQGDRLVTMDSLELGQLRSRYLQARAKVDLSRKNYEREARLHERRIASGREKLHAESTLREARIGLEGAREQLRLLGSSARGLDQSNPQRFRGGGTILVAPTDGSVVAMHAVRGERISPDESVVTVADLSKVWVWADVYERDLAALLTATRGRGKMLRATVGVAAFPEQQFAGTVEYVGAVMEEATRTVKVRVEVDNPDELLRPGMFADVSIDLDGGTLAILAPDEAVMEHDEQHFVFIKVGPRRFLRRDVEARPVGNGQLAILGADAGEEIVVRGAFLLKSDVLREQMGAGCAH